MALAVAVKNGKHNERRDDDEESDEEEIPDCVGNIRGFRFDCFRWLLLRSGRRLGLSSLFAPRL